MPNKISKGEGALALNQALKAARHQRGWSQRALSMRAALPQSQISRIENGDVDPQLSTLLELARALELDLQLVPRSALTAVEAVVRDSENRRIEQAVRHQLSRLKSLSNQLADAVGGADRDAFADTVQELIFVAPLLQTEVARYVLEQTATRLQQALQKGDPTVVAEEMDQARHSLKTLRNNHVHSVPPQRPAYMLDED